MKQKTIALIDGNNFFASCEILMNPDLKNKPVCVLSNNDGCVIARSNEAKSLGITMGMPYFMAKKKFPNAIYLSSNFTLYHELSQRMMQILRKYSDKIDIYSIDEAFIDLTNSDKIFKMTYKELAKEIKRDIATNVGISVSVGIANSKILAKMATHKAKKKDGTYVIEHHLIKEELMNQPIEEVWGIGKNIARSLRKHGIFYANEILLKDDDFFKYYFGKKGLELKYELAGESVIPLTGISEAPKSIQRTRAFPNFSTDKNYIKTEIHLHLNNVCKKLRENNLETDYVAVMLRTKDFKIQYKEKRLEYKTNSEILLTKEIENLYNQMYIQGIIYRSSGVLVLNLTNRSKQQLSLFEDTKAKKSEKISYIVDKLENRFGKKILTVGELGLNEIQKLHIRKNKTE